MTCTVLDRVLEFRYPADSTLRRFFREHSRLGRRDRALIAETVFGVLRHRRYLMHRCGADTRRTVLAALFQQHGAESGSLLRAASADERAWLEGMPGSARDDDLPLGAHAELPDWVVELMRGHANDDEILRMGIAMQQAAPLDLRVNPLRMERDAAIARLRADGFPCAPTPYSPLGIRLAAKPALDEYPLYLDGTLEVQDEGSQLIGWILAPRRREMVVDFCAGAGGKTLLLGALMRSEGRLYAFDVAERRLARLRMRLKRSGLSNVHPLLIAHENEARVRRLAGKIDRVLVDAPCTGLGTLRRNPDLKWRQTPQTLAALVTQQASILSASARLLKPGGRLVYATCSILHEENEAIVTAFRARHPEFEALDCGELLRLHGIEGLSGAQLHLDPQAHGTDGFFASALQRSG